MTRDGAAYAQQSSLPHSSAQSSCVTARPHSALRGSLAASLMMGPIVSWWTAVLPANESRLRAIPRGGTRVSIIFLLFQTCYAMLAGSAQSNLLHTGSPPGYFQESIYLSTVSPSNWAPLPL